ncbi:PAS domain S-box protein [Sphingosinicella sp. CPCC 101087]|uniref:PAS domain-containing hybrid sensor histidine kinase/response regulator n=1 Tax=Sphingosinicella sp. CPCC 101087 TaxID=2497754 RepID=UPI00101C7DE2|nr:PAS domain S-box protein [Sphingosinicella sp. CPCC 101087]
MSGPAHSDDRVAVLEAENARLVAALRERDSLIEALQGAVSVDPRIRLVADALPILISYIGADGRYRYNNKAYQDWFGSDRGQLRGLHMREVLGEAAYEEVRPLVERVLQGERVSRNLGLPYSRGGPRYVRLDYVPDRQTNGKVSGFFVVVEDLTEAHRSEEELRESEARFRAMADSAPAPIWVTNASGIEFANRALSEFTGLGVEALRGDTWMSLAHPDDLPMILKRRDDGWRSRASFDFEARFRRRDGEWRWLRASCEPRDGSGAFLGYVGLAFDVTDSRRALEELRESEAALRAESRMLGTVNRLGAALAGELDLERLVQFVTDAGVELTGAQFGAFFYNVLNSAGESYMLYTISGVDRSEFEKFPMPRNTKVFAPTFQGEGVVLSDDITCDPRYGHNTPYRGMPSGHLPVRSYLAVPVASRSGEVIGGLFFGHAEPGRFKERHGRLLEGIAGQAAVAIDNARLFESAQREIGERRRAEEALRELNQSLEQRIAAAIAEREQAEAALRQAQKMEAVGQLTGGIAHDFNNLLTVISGNLDMAARRLAGTADPRVQRAISSAMVGAQRAATLTQRLLAFSRRQPLAPKAIDANALLDGMSELLHRTLGETIAVETSLAVGLPRIEVDPHQLESAILNLAVNARDAMPDGGRLLIETGAAQLREDEPWATDPIAPGQYVAISVSDTGTGMNEDTRQRAFEPFFTTKDVGKGTGLGLSMVYGFVRQSGGHLRIESEEGRGTRIHVYLPRLAATEFQEESVELVATPLGAGEETVLVCEDDDDVRAYTVELLGELGYRVLEAHDGDSAMRMIEDTDLRIDMLFTDVVLPGGTSGAILAEQARQARPGLRILFTTGYARDAIVHDGRLDPGIDLVAKPFTHAELAMRVREVLDRS